MPNIVSAYWTRQVKLGPTVLGTAIIMVAASVAFAYFHQTKSPEVPVKLGIDDLAREVKAELEKLMIEREQKGEEAAFRLKNFDLEISFVVKATQKGKAEVSPEVVVVGTETERSREATHKVTLHMDLIPPQPVTIPAAVKTIELPPTVVNLPPGRVK